MTTDHQLSDRTPAVPVFTPPSLSPAAVKAAVAAPRGLYPTLTPPPVVTPEPPSIPAGEKAEDADQAPRA